MNVNEMDKKLNEMFEFFYNTKKVFVFTENIEGELSVNVADEQAYQQIAKNQQGFIKLIREYIGNQPIKIIRYKKDIPVYKKTTTEYCKGEGCK